jgi:cytochrome c
MGPTARLLSADKPEAPAIWPYGLDFVMAFFEANKVIAAVLTAGVAALGSGFVSELVFKDHESEEHAYQIATVGVAEQPTSEAAADSASEAPAGQNLGTLIAAADPGAGEKVAGKCKACHTFDDGGANRIGPNLYGIVGRQIAGHDGFSYSDALQAKAGETWSYEGLDGFLASPKTWAPGTKMSFAGIKSPEDRAALLAYLRAQSANPLPSPE